MGQSILTWILLAAGAFLGYEYLFNKGGDLDYVSKVISNRARANYVRGGVEWGGGGDDYYYY